MPLNIPLPALPGDTLRQALTAGSNMYSNIMNPILNREKMAQQKQMQEAQLEQQWKQHVDELALRKQQEARLGANMGLQRQVLQQNLLKLQHANDPMWGLNNKMDLIKRLQGMAGDGTSQVLQKPELPQGSQNYMAQLLQGGQEMPQGGGTMMLPGQQPQAQSQPQGQPQGGQLPGGVNLDDIIRGLTYQAFNLKPPPSGGETPEQKHQGAINQAISIDEAKANRKKIDEIEKTAQSLLPYLGKVNTIEDILKRKPELAGRTTQLADMLGMTKDEDVGTFLSAAQALQAHMAKEMSSRGGYGVAKLVEQAKPNIGKSTAYNQGVVKELKQSMRESFDQMKQEYERLSNKKFPYNFEQYFQEQTAGMLPTNNQKGAGSAGQMVVVINPKGKKFKTTKANALHLPQGWSHG